MLWFLAAAHVTMFLVTALNFAYVRRTTAASASDVPLPFVSIVVPARNEAANLRRLVPTLLEQAYPSYEVIVYDDHSTDDTWDVLQSFADLRLCPIHGAEPPKGWVGKVHALYQATRSAHGTIFLFLDADAELIDHRALERMVRRFLARDQPAVMTGITRLRGRGQLLVSLVPNAILSVLPWWLRTRYTSKASGLNGQCWLIDAQLYQRLEPHKTHPGEVLEDVVIGRYLARNGYPPVLVDLQHDVAVYMYNSFGDAWRGFRKNAYLLLGGTVPSFVLLGGFYVFVYLAAPFLSIWFLGSIILLKGITDWRSGFPIWLAILAPVSFALGTLLQIDSAVSHWRGRVTWKSRQVAR